MTIPEKEYSIFCSTFKFKPEDISDKKHIVKFQPLITSGNEDIIEEVELLSCSFTEDVSFGSECSQNFSALQNCTKFLISWHYGQKSFEFPHESGLPFGGSNFSPYILIKIHYHNFYKKKNIIDDSGLRMFLAKKLRKYDSGILEVGVQNSKIGIPPKEENFVLSGHCISDCTKKFDRIKVFGYYIHSHFSSTKVRTSLFENDKRIMKIFNEENFYSTHQASERITTVEVKPGDVLITTCTFNTEKNDSWIMVGLGVMDIRI